MRRALAVFGTLAAAATLALTITQSADAAQGNLVVNGKTYNNPSGCYESDIWPLHVGNHTDQPVLVFGGPQCQGGTVAVVDPGSSIVNEFGQSVYVD